MDNAKHINETKKSAKHKSVYEEPRTRNECLILFRTQNVLQTTQNHITAGKMKFLKHFVVGYDIECMFL